MIKQDLQLSHYLIYPDSKELSFYFSPGRINIIGEHIDYNGGLVFPCAISLGTYAAISLRDDDTIYIYSANFKTHGVLSFSLA